MEPPAARLKISSNITKQEEEIAPATMERRSRVPRRFLLFLGYVAIVAVAFALPLQIWATFAMGSDVHSYVLLIPFVTAYLLWIRWFQLPRGYKSSPALAIVPFVAGLFALLASWRLQLNPNDYASMVAVSFFCFVIAGAYFILGRRWMRAAAFPMAFLVFMIPLPAAAVDYLEIASQNASAEVSNILFMITETPTLRDGNLFQLPGITIQVAQECSGIRSSLVLFITSLLAAHLFLRTLGHRAVLVASVIPLGLLRNGFRILVVALLCVHIGPHMINSPIHRKGGPIFFAASLVPLFILLWALYRSEQKTAAKGSSTALGNQPKD
jgi:exosortase C (VPDSG-CTERM-specific)